MNDAAWNSKAKELVEQERRYRIEQIRGGIATRLKRACDYLDEAEFVALVDKMSACSTAGRSARRSVGGRLRLASGNWHWHGRLVTDS